MTRDKRSLKARDIERLENTSFASVLGGGAAPLPALDLPILEGLGETEQCSDSCPLACTCHCVSWGCCITHGCIDPNTVGCTATAGCTEDCTAECTRTCFTPLIPAPIQDILEGGDT